MLESKLTYDELLQIVKVFESSKEFSGLHLKYGDVEIDLHKNGFAPGPAIHQLPPASETIISLEKPATITLGSDQTERNKEAAPPSSPNDIAPGACVIKSPMVGVFYRAPEPGTAPFVSVGQRVTPDTTVCIIEVMKLMNSIQAKQAGVVTQILVADGAPVEFGQPLVVIDPNG